MSLALLLGAELSADVRAGFEVYGISAPGPYRDRLRGLGVRPVELSHLSRRWSPINDIAAAIELWRVLRDNHIDVLHTHNPKTGVIGRVVGRMAGAPVVVNTCHGLWVSKDDPLLKRSLVYLIEAAAAQFSDREMFQNAEDKHTLRWASRRSAAELVGNGVDLKRFRFNEDARNRVRAALGILPTTILVGGVGRLVAEKGLAEFAAAAEQLSKRASFVWAGGEDQAKPGCDVGEETRLLGHWEDMPALYAALDVFVLPSHREGLPRSAMEAAACGRAMVLTDIRGSREIGAHKEEILVVPPRDSNALSAAIGQLILDPELRSRLGKAAYTRATIYFNQERVAQQSIDAYHAIASEKGLGWDTR